MYHPDKPSYTWLSTCVPGSCISTLLSFAIKKVQSLCSSPSPCLPREQKYQTPQSHSEHAHSPVLLIRPIHTQCDVAKATTRRAVAAMCVTMTEAMQADVMAGR